MHPVVAAIIEQLAIIPGATTNLKLEIDAEVPPTPGATVNRIKGTDQFTGD
jgi:hypothetical protein